MGIADKAVDGRKASAGSGDPDRGGAAAPGPALLPPSTPGAPPAVEGHRAGDGQSDGSGDRGGVNRLPPDCVIAIDPVFTRDRGENDEELRDRIRRSIAKYAKVTLYGPAYARIDDFDIEFTVDVTPPLDPADLEREYQAFLRALGEKP